MSDREGRCTGCGASVAGQSECEACGDVVECSECNGSGYYEWSDKEQCETCEGKGFIPRKYSKRRRM